MGRVPALSASGQNQFFCSLRFEADKARLRTTTTENDFYVRTFALLSLNTYYIDISIYIFINIKPNR